MKTVAQHQILMFEKHTIDLNLPLKANAEFQKQPAIFIPTKVQKRAQRLDDIFIHFHITTDLLTARNKIINQAAILQKRELL